MKKIFFSILCLFLLIVRVLSQSINEKDIKLSGKYYYGEAISINDTTSKQIAWEELFASISNEYKPVIKGDILAIGVKYITFPRGNKVRTIAYILKEDVINSKKKQNKYSDSFLQSTDSVKQTNDTIANKDEKNIIVSTADKFIYSLITIEKFDDLYPILSEQKHKGKLIYGKESAFTDNRANCYIMIFNTDNKLETILGKGDMDRFDYKNKRLISNYKDFFKNTKEIWLLIIE